MTNIQTPRRRVSSSVRAPLLAALAIATAALPLAACSDDVVSNTSNASDTSSTEDMLIVDTFTSKEDCTASWRYEEDVCKKFDETAKQEFDATAPHFDSLDACKQQSDTCVSDTPPAQQQQAHGGGSSHFYYYHSSPVYTPTYGGFSVARPASNAETAVPRAVYKTPSSGYATLGGVHGLNAGEVMAAPRANFGTAMTSTVTPSARATAFASHPSAFSGVSARGGFGGSFGHASVGG